MIGEQRRPTGTPRKTRKPEDTNLNYWIFNFELSEWLESFAQLAENLYLGNTNKPALKTNQLKTNLTDTQRGKLFNLLVKHKFIPADTNKEGFICAFGGVNDKYKIFRITWLAQNQALRVLLIAISGQTVDQLNEIVPNIFKKTDRKGFTIPSEKQKYNGKEQQDIMLIEKLIKEAQK